MNESIVVTGRIRIPYQWAAGPFVSRFLTALRDKKELWGVGCSVCKKVIVPPQARCPFCDGACDTPKQVGPKGTLETWTRSGDRTFGVIRLNGADTGMVHLLEGEPRTGQTVEPVFNDERKGHILDIRHFRAVT